MTTEDMLAPVNNAVRAAWAKEAMSAFLKAVGVGDEDPSFPLADITDLLTDVAHLAASEGFSRNEVLGVFAAAIGSWSAELRADEPGENDFCTVILKDPRTRKQIDSASNYTVKSWCNS
jgi:hypothetical protein